MTQTKTQSISISSMSLSLHRPSGANNLVMDYLAILWNTDPTSASYSNIWLPFMWWHLSMTTGPLRRETSRQRSSVLISLSAVYENTWKQDFSVSPWKTSGGRHHSQAFKNCKPWLCLEVIFIWGFIWINRYFLHDLWARFRLDAVQGVLVFLQIQYLTLLYASLSLQDYI